MSQTQQETSATVEIRRYSNRRFYDTSRSAHVTLEEIRDIISSGRDVRITDASSEEDITSRILTHIILEYDDQKISAFPAAMLHRLLRSGERLLLDLIGKSFENAIRVFQDSQRSAEEQWQRIAAMTPGPQEAARWWQESLEGAVPSWPKPAPGEKSPSDENAPSAKLERLVEDLRGQLKGVQDELKEMRRNSSGGMAGATSPKATSAKPTSAARKRS